ncbi:splicing factor U2AF 65 kDa subunit-like isoform X2 [Hylaeus volcanicus]|nr:splicing factor U2AF 65 kDa subunit-like isoform X2 [Hylaeus volcanicus]XP_053990985.1 splicing factor U2AF 65 kDa subunit-like isoform X2 [Hylaeus volcanicus]
MGNSKRSKRKNEHDLIENNPHKSRKHHTSRYRNDSIESRGTWHKHHCRRSRGRESSVSHPKKSSKTDLSKELSDTTEDNYVKTRQRTRHSHHYKRFSDDEDDDGKRNKSSQRHSSRREHRHRHSSSETYRRSVSKVRHKTHATKQHSSRSYRDRSNSVQKNHKRIQSDESMFRSRSRSYNRKPFSKDTEQTKDFKKKERSQSKEAVKPVAKPVKKSKWDVSVAEMSDIDGKIGLLAVDPGRRLHIGNLPSDTVDVSLVQFLNGALLAAAGVDFTTAALTGFFPVSRVQLVAQQNYALIDLRTVADVNCSLQLNGIQFNGQALKISRLSDVVLPPPPEKPRGFDHIPGTSKTGMDVKVYVTDLPVTVTDDELRIICSRYGVVRSAALMKDLKTGQSMGCGVIEFDTAANANAAVKALDRKPMGFKIPRFHKGLMLPGLSRLTDKGERVTHTSSIVTELPTSVTYKIFSNALIGSQVKAARQEGAKPSMVVQLLNAVFPEDLIKDEDYNSIMEDMKNEASQYGTLVNVVIPRPPEDLSFRPGVGKVFLHFSDITAARKAQAELNGRRYEQRRTICAAFYNLERFLDGKYTLV